MALGENAAFLSVSLAALAVVVLITLIVFFVRHRHDEQFMAPFAQASEPRA